jgi:hypothetical protein
MFAWRNPRQSEQCQCRVVQGCWCMTQTEHGDGAAFMRIAVLGRHARNVLENILSDEEPRFHQEHDPLENSGMMWPTLNGWCAILAGRSLKKPVRAAALWTPADIDRLRTIWQAEGMTGCIREFPDRTYSALTCALRRYEVRSEGRRAEAIA